MALSIRSMQLLIELFVYYSPFLVIYVFASSKFENSIPTSAFYDLFFNHHPLSTIAKSHFCVVPYVLLSSPCLVFF